MRKGAYQAPAGVKTFNILEFLGKKGGASFTEIYTQLATPKSSTYQILQTLESQGYIRHAGDSTKYSLGLKLLEFGTLAVSSLDIRTEALPLLRELSLKTNRTCHLAILDDTEAVYVAKVEPVQPFRLNSWEGKRTPLHSTAIGKVLLAWQDEEKIDEILSRITLTRNTEKTIVDPNVLRDHLRIVSERA